MSERTSTGTYYYSLNSLGKTEAVSNPWQFAGGFYDATTGLYKFGTRYYSPTLGRWTQQDPVGGSVGKVGSGNAYVYADDAPVMKTDPSGRAACLYFSNAALDTIGWGIEGIGTEMAIIGAIGSLIVPPLGVLFLVGSALELALGAFLVWYVDKYEPNGETRLFVAKALPS